METIEQEILAIKQRNQKVELDKKWETSWTRRLAIAVLTYIVALAWLLMIREHLAALKAFVPMAGYILSTLSLPVVKQAWAGRQTPSQPA